MRSGRRRGVLLGAPVREIAAGTVATKTRAGLWPLVAPFLKLGAIGSGGPVALVGFMPSRPRLRSDSPLLLRETKNILTCSLCSSYTGLLVYHEC